VLIGAIAALLAAGIAAFILTRSRKPPDLPPPAAPAVPAGPAEKGGVR
jgi:FlaG/FlaF family flagellin (archaellin)